MSNRRCPISSGLHSTSLLWISQSLNRWYKAVNKQSLTFHSHIGYCNVFVRCPVRRISGLYIVWIVLLLTSSDKFWLHAWSAFVSWLFLRNWCFLSYWIRKTVILKFYSSEKSTIAASMFRKKRVLNDGILGIIHPDIISRYCILKFRFLLAPYGLICVNKELYIFCEK